MTFLLEPWHLLLAGLAAWVNQSQQQRIEYLATEVQVLKEMLGKKRLLLNDDQRRRLAVKAKAVGRRQLDEFATLFTPETLLRWHRRLVAYGRRPKFEPFRLNNAKLPKNLTAG